MEGHKTDRGFAGAEVPGDDSDSDRRFLQDSPLYILRTVGTFRRITLGFFSNSDGERRGVVVVLHG